MRIKNGIQRKGLSSTGLSVRCAPQVGVDKRGVADQQAHHHAQLGLEAGRVAGVEQHLDEEGHEGTAGRRGGGPFRSRQAAGER